MKQQFSKEELIELLNDLNNHLAKTDTTVTINTYGGFVLCFYGLRFSTEDIDAVYVDSSLKVDALVKQIANKRNIASSWLNSAIKEIVLEDMKKEELSRCEKLKFSNIILNFPSAQQLLAMKLYSARAKDLKDAVGLTKLLGITTVTQLDALVKSFFGECVRKRNIANNNVIGRFLRNVIDSL